MADPIIVLREHCTINSVSLGQSEVQLNNSSLKILKCDKIDAYFEGNRYTGILLSYLKAWTFLQCKIAKYLNFK